MVLHMNWLLIGFVAAFIAFLGAKGFRQLQVARISLVAAGGLSTVPLMLAAWLFIHGHSYLAIGLCLVSAAAAWEFYRYAEDEAFRTVINEILGRQRE